MEVGREEEREGERERKRDRRREGGREKSKRWLSRYKRSVWRGRKRQEERMECCGGKGDERRSGKG